MESGGGVCTAKRLLELIVVQQDFGILMIQLELEGTKLVGFMSLFFEMDGGIYIYKFLSSFLFFRFFFYELIFIFEK